MTRLFIGSMNLEFSIDPKIVLCIISIYDPIQMFQIHILQDFLTYDKSRTNAICWWIKINLLILILFPIGLVTLIQSSSVLAHKHESTNHLVLPTTEEEEKEELPPSWSDSLGLQYDQLFQVKLRNFNFLSYIWSHTYLQP